MHARELVELAAVAACHGPALLTGGGRLSPDGFEQYWLTSKCRLDRWGRAIKGFLQPVAAWPWTSPTSHAGSVEAVIEEVLASEVLTRVWAALLSAYDRHRGGHEAEYFGRGIYLAHLETRNRVLKWLITGPGISAQQAVRLNRLRQGTERWADLLVGCLTAVDVEVAGYATHPERARQFAHDIGGAGGMAVAPLRWQLTVASLRATFLAAFHTEPANPDSNVRIAGSILRTFEPEMFDSTGLFPSLWVSRLEHLGRDAELLIGELFADSSAVSAPRDDDVSADSIDRPAPRRFG